MFVHVHVCARVHMLVCVCLCVRMFVRARMFILCVHVCLCVCMFAHVRMFVRARVTCLYFATQEPIYANQLMGTMDRVELQEKLERTRLKAQEV